MGFQEAAKAHEQLRLKHLAEQQPRPNVAPEDALSAVLLRLGLSLSDFAMMLARLRDTPLWQGRLLDAVIESGAVEVTIPHGLGRAHLGAVVVLSERAWPVAALPPTDDTTVTLTAGSLQGNALGLRVWVF